MAYENEDANSEVDKSVAPLVHFSAEETRSTLNSLSAAVLASNALPRGDTRFVALLTNPALSATWESSVSQTNALVANVLAHATNSSSQAPENLTETIDSSFADALNETLERAHTALDAAEGFRQTPLTSVETRVNIVASRAASPESDSQMLPADYKPQCNFYDYPIDNSDAPFVPPFSTPPSTVKADGDSQSASTDNATSKQNKHPYETEIKESVKANCALVFDPDNVTVFRALKKTPFTYIDTEEKLMEMAAKLSKCTELAFDIENHSDRSFLGFVCLIQVSSRSEDFIIDAMALRAQMHRALASIFTDASITKVFHGADNDMEWLERDFGIYVVNVFDTGQASRALNLPLASLSFLLDRFCDVKSVNKKMFQRSDWRKRPVPQNMLDYARSDTHYLLYLYDRLRVELAAQKKLDVAYRRSGKIALRRFKKPTYKHDFAHAWELTVKNGLGFDMNQVVALKSLMQWREATAREQDESMHYVLPNYGMYAIVRAKHLARSPENIRQILPFRCKAPVAIALRGEVASLISEALDSKIDPNFTSQLLRKNKPDFRKRLGRGRTVKLNGNAKEFCPGKPVGSRQGSSQAESQKSIQSWVDKAKQGGSSTGPNPRTSLNVPVVAKKQSVLMQDSSDESGIEVITKEAPVANEPKAELKDSRHKDKLQVMESSKSVFDLSDSDDSEQRPNQPPAEDKSAPMRQSNRGAIEPLMKSDKSVFDLSESESDAFEPA